MDETKISADRLEILKRIKEYEKAGRFDEDVENDPPAPELLPDQVDYLCKKLSSKISRRIANRIGDKFFLKLIKKNVLVIDGVTGEENLSASETARSSPATTSTRSTITWFSIVSENIYRGRTSIKSYAKEIIRITPVCTDICSAIAIRCPYRAIAVRWSTLCPRSIPF